MSSTLLEDATIPPKVADTAAATTTTTTTEIPSMNNSSANLDGASHHHHLFHQHHQTGKRVRQFFRPDGRKVHIASSPEEHQRMHRHLSVAEPKEFDLYIHGSPEHLEAIRELHSHHEARRTSLREQHSSLYDEFENVTAELGALSNELQTLTDHGVALDANFSKFGYSAHLRTKDVDDSTTSLPTTQSTSHTSHDWDAERRQGSTLKFFQRPVVRQYFHKGLLWRSPKSSEASSSELFVDLFFVGIIGVLGDTAAEHPNGTSFVQFLIKFMMAWRIWQDMTLTVNWFEIDDIVQRICIIFYLACLFGFTTNIQYAFETTYAPLTGFFLAERLFCAAWLFICAYLIPMIRGTLIWHGIVMVCTSAIWVASIHVEWPNQLALIFIAIALDLAGTFMLVAVTRFTHFKNDKGSSMKRFIETKLKPCFEFYPAINIEHRTARNDAFITLVFGSGVLAILFQNRSEVSVNAYFGKAILGLILAFSFNWIYFEIDHNKFIHVHAIRRYWMSAIAWQMMHIPFIMGFILAAASLADIVLAHDTSGTHLEALGEAYVRRSEEEVLQGIRWFFCGGIGISLFSMGLISFCHIHKTIPNARLKKRPRLLIRAAVSIVIVCLPLAHENLSSLSLVAITTSCVVFQLLIEIYGISCTGDEFWTGGFCAEDKRNCRYSARCPLDKRRRRMLEKKVKSGEEINISDLIRLQQMESKESLASNDSGETLTAEKDASRLQHDREPGWHV